MNHKPKQLTQKVYELALKTGGSFYPETNSATLQKFAEAIIEECAQIADSNTSAPYKNYGDKIRSHFGVKDYV
jgi:hypothetical protein